MHVDAEASSSRLTLDDVRAPKVAQVDADELDEGLVQMLGERLEKAVGNLKVDNLVGWTGSISVLTVSVARLDKGAQA